MTARASWSIPALATTLLAGCFSGFGSDATKGDTVSQSRDGAGTPSSPECSSTVPCGTDEHCVLGACVADSEEGQACSHNSDCIAPLVCNWGKGHVCTAPSLPGEACSNDSDCLLGYACPGGSTLFKSKCDCALDCSEGTSCGLDGCVAPGLVVAGEPCAYNANCAGGLICDWEQAPWVCRPAKLVGEPCGHDTDCADGRCDDKAHTCVDTCTLPADCSNGDACWTPLISLEKGPRGTCKPPAGLGEKCEGPYSCSAGLGCNEASVCTQSVVDGGACTGGADCVIGSNCVANLCAPAGAEGEPCAISLWNVSHPSCADGLTCRSVTEGGALSCEKAPTP